MKLGSIEKPTDGVDIDVVVEVANVIPPFFRELSLVPNVQNPARDLKKLFFGSWHLFFGEGCVKCVGDS